MLICYTKHFHFIGLTQKIKKHGLGDIMISTLIQINAQIAVDGNYYTSTSVYAVCAFDQNYWISMKMLKKDGKCERMAKQNY